MKKLIELGVMLSVAVSAMAQEPAPKTLAAYYFSELPKEDMMTLDGQTVYKIENTNDTALQVQLLKILKPRVSTSAYAITGRVKYENVQGTGYLEMWNFFPPAQPGMPEGQFFSRTLGDSGAMGKITGTSDWRDFMLPFDPASASSPPTRLEINLILPGRGTVYLTPVKLVKYSGGFSSTGETSVGATMDNGWWPAKAAPFVGGIGGPVIGCLGGLLGWLSQKGMARRFVLATWKCCIAFGILCLMAMVIALIVKQPWYITMPLGVFGVVCTSVFGIMWPTARKRYDEFEMRRMASMDVA